MKTAGTASPRLSRAFDRLVQGAVILSLVAIWWAVTTADLVTPIFLPAPGAVLTSFVDGLATSAFWQNLLVSAFSAACAYLVAVVTGFSVGLLVGRDRFARDVFEPLLSGAFSVPLVIFFPLILLLVGIGPLSKIIFAAIYGFFPVALNTIAGIAQVERRYVVYAETLGATRWQQFRRLLLPAAMPQVIAGLRIAFVITFASVIAGEMIASVSGLGHDIRDSADLMEPARMFAVIAVVIMVTAVMNLLLTRLGERT